MEWIAEMDWISWLVFGQLCLAAVVGAGFIAVRLMPDDDEKEE